MVGCIWLLHGLWIDRTMGGCFDGCLFVCYLSALHVGAGGVAAGVGVYAVSWSV